MKKTSRKHALHEQRESKKAERAEHKKTVKRKDGKKKTKIEKVMREYKKGTLHSGSIKGPKVTHKRQAIAIALSEARKSKVKTSKKKK